MKNKLIYKGQRSKEKGELFGRFRLRAIKDIYTNKFFALFDHRCFKCDIKERPHKIIGHPPVLCIDHHIPMALGGHLVPGNLVSLCRRCNNKKLDHPPEEFYTKNELNKLKPFLSQQADIFAFTFDDDYWNKDRKEYLLSLGVEHALVNELLYNEDHLDYVGLPSDDTKFTISIDLSNIYDIIKDR